MPVPDHQIQVSVLLAARNEEHNIKKCLHSLSALNFPINQIEILIGDDDSDDHTAEIIQNFIHDKSQFAYYKISENISGLKGKANVLAQLSHKAQGKYFLYCDADITVPTTWVSSMLRHFQGNTGVVVGLTRMKKINLLSDFLSLEWMFILTIMRFFSLFKIPMTGLGNNMAITREAYDAVGGYEKIGFSIVEDYALFIAIIRKKYAFVQTYTNEIIADSEPILTVSELIIQRKRWMHGIMASPLILQICVIACALFIPAMAILSIWDLERSVTTIVRHYVLITSIIVLAIIILKQKDLWKTAFFFWFYLMAICLLMLVIYVVPGKTLWKGREY